MTMRLVTLKLPEVLVDLLDHLAVKYSTSRSEIIRRAIIEYLKKELGDKHEKRP